MMGEQHLPSLFLYKEWKENFTMAIYDKLVNINGRQYGVFSREYFTSHMETLKDDDHCAVEIEKDGKTFTLPIRTNTSSADKPGIYSVDGKINLITYPNKDEEEYYMPAGENVLTFSDHGSLQSLSDAKKKLDENINKFIENADGESVYRPPLLETDSAEMRAMKECIIAKNIDLDKYKDRFGANYPNDKRKLKDDSITLNMIERMCKNLDIKVDLVFTDSDDNVPNAMNKVIRANIIPGDGSCIISDVEEE